VGFALGSVSINEPSLATANITTKTQSQARFLFTILHFSRHKFTLRRMQIIFRWQWWIHQWCRLLQEILQFTITWIVCFSHLAVTLRHHEKLLDGLGSYWQRREMHVVLYYTGAPIQPWKGKILGSESTDKISIATLPVVVKLTLGLERSGLVTNDWPLLHYHKPAQILQVLRSLIINIRTEFPGSQWNRTMHMYRQMMTITTIPCGLVDILQIFSNYQ